MSRAPILRGPSVAAIVLTLCGAATAADWPQWRGANRDGRSAETGLLQEWPEGGPPLAFKASGLGGGYSSVAVAGERIFTMGDLGDGQYVLALSRADGKQLWKTRVGETHADQYLGPRSTPTVDGDRLYLVTTAGDVVCLAADSGERQWSRSLVRDFGGRLMKAMGTYDWKFASSSRREPRTRPSSPSTRPAARRSGAPPSRRSARPALTAPATRRWWSPRAAASANTCS